MRIEERLAARHGRDALTETCVGAHRCSVDLRDAEVVCLACDASIEFSRSSGRIPDFVLATLTAEGRVQWLVVEMTAGGSGAESASELQGQLQAGADSIRHDETLHFSDARLIPVVLRRKDKRVTALQRIDRPQYQVRFGSSKIRIRERLCGETLAAIVALTTQERLDSGRM